MLDLSSSYLLAPVNGWFHWLPMMLFVAASLDAHGQNQQAPSPPTRAKSQTAAPAAQPERITISGIALDDSLNVPIPDLWLYLNETKYGAVTDAQGKFSFSFPTGWKPVRGGELRLFVAPIGYTFKPLRRKLDWRTYDPAHPLVLRLASAPERGRPNYHGFRLMAPPVPPPVYPPSVRTARP